MLTTYLTRAWGLQIPIIGAPMSPMSGGKLAAAISNCGGLGMIGVSSTQPTDQLERDVAEYRSLTGDRPFRNRTHGLVAWRLAPDLLDAAIVAKPFAIALSFGDPARYVKRVHDAGAQVIAQVQDRQTALTAQAAGVDLLVAQGTEAGGHTGSVGTLPLLQIMLANVRLPVLAAGGIGNGRGLAAVLAAGAQGGWIGTALLVAEEARNSTIARSKLLAARETDTTHTRVFDLVQGIPWPTTFPGRALSNAFTARWDGHESELAGDAEVRGAFQEARRREDYASANLYAGQSVGMLDRVEPASEIVGRIVRDAETHLRAVKEMVG